MKVGLLTVHQSVNCGASLQAAALYKTIHDLGYSVKVIDYRPWYFVSELDPARKRGPKSIKSTIKTTLIRSRLRKTQEIFDKFTNVYCPDKTQRIESAERLREVDGLFDAVVCGSDQIWNPPHVHFDTSWFIDFITHGKKISYAASIGKDNLNGREADWIKAGAMGMDGLGVREQSAVNQLKAMGLSANLCLDPTLLRPAYEWEAMAQPPSCELPQEYIFYYPLERNSRIEYDLIVSLKRITKLPVVALSDALRKPRGADIVVTGFGPGEFLWLIKNAQYAVNNSFHGAAFSIIFKKKLISFKNSTKNCRLQNLFDLAGFHNYQINCVDEIMVPDWENRFVSMTGALERLEPLRVQSISYLRKMLDGETSK